MATNITRALVEALEGLQITITYYGCQGVLASPIRSLMPLRGSHDSIYKALLSLQPSESA